jgi:5-formyltetrahydrofolate cyclo-ligase
MGITEPKEIVPIDSLDIDLVLVPMLVCDLVGYRVGYGKGYYDRFLSTCREDVVRLGLSYFEPIERIQDTHRFDVPLTHCLTPTEFYEF